MVPAEIVIDTEDYGTRGLHWPAKTEDAKRVLLMIPGNPGNFEYYRDFLDAMHEHMDRNIHILVVQHAGHMMPAYNKSNKKVWTLSDQVKHKCDVLEWIIDRFRNANVVLTGHSVGAYIATQILKQRPDFPIVHVINLFPTLENIHQTPNANRLWLLFLPWSQFLLASFAYGLSFFPKSALQKLIQIATWQTTYDAWVTSQLVDFNIVFNILHMTETEMQHIRLLEMDFFQKHSKKMTFYYGKEDDWAPIEHYELMRSRFPTSNVTLCNLSLPHAFVLDGRGPELASKVAKWIDNIY